MTARAEVAAAQHTARQEERMRERDRWERIRQIADEPQLLGDPPELDASECEAIARDLRRLRAVH